MHLIEAEFAFAYAVLSKREKKHLNGVNIIVNDVAKSLGKRYKSNNNGRGD